MVTAKAAAYSATYAVTYHNQAAVKLRLAAAISYYGGHQCRIVVASTLYYGGHQCRIVVASTLYYGGHQCRIVVASTSYHHYSTLASPIV